MDIEKEIIERLKTDKNVILSIGSDKPITELWDNGYGCGKLGKLGDKTVLYYVKSELKLR